MPGGTETLSSGRTRKEEEKSSGIRTSAQREAKIEKVLWYVRKAVQAIFPQGRKEERCHRRYSSLYAGKKTG
jgi:hypothetical protein